MSLAAVESATCDVPPPRRAVRETAATSPFAFAAESKQPEPVLGPDWLERTAKLSRMPSTQKNLMTLLLRQIETLRAVSDEQAVVLGELIGGARSEGLRTLVGLFRTSMPLRATWVRSLLSGLVKQWPDGLPSFAAVADARHLSQTLTALEESTLDSRQEFRAFAVRAVGILAAKGEAKAFRALERVALRSGLALEERQAIVKLLADRALEALPQLSCQRDIQPAVDVAVGLVDVSLKTGSADVLNQVLERVDPEALPAEVTLALLTTTKAASARLPERQSLSSRFEKAIRARYRPDVNALMRFAR